MFSLASTACKNDGRDFLDNPIVSGGENNTITVNAFRMSTLAIALDCLLGITLLVVGILSAVHIIPIASAFSYVMIGAAIFELALAWYIAIPTAIAGCKKILSCEQASDPTN